MTPHTTLIDLAGDANLDDEDTIDYLWELIETTEDPETKLAAAMDFNDWIGPMNVSRAKPELPPNTHSLLGDYWYAVKDGDPAAAALYDRHYSAKNNRRKTNRQFGGPGERLVLMTPDSQALLVWRRQMYRHDQNTGVECAVFRNEGPIRSSTLLLDAMDVAWTRWPTATLFTFVDPSKIKSTNPGYCFIKAGWHKSPWKSRKQQLIILYATPKLIITPELPPSKPYLEYRP